jgi:type II secretory pathway pseudopilin PulG
MLFLHSRARSRTAFTLVEVMLAVFIFTVVSGAMLAVFMAATRLYQQGESVRAAADEATAVLSLLRRDCQAAVGSQAGGHWFTGLIDGGDCVTGWVIRDPDGGRNQHSFVIWGHDQSDQGRDTKEQLVRRVVDWPLTTDFWDNLKADPASAITGAPLEEVVSTSCMHFSTWLCGVHHSHDKDQYAISTAPKHDTDWQIFLDDSQSQELGDPLTFLSGDPMYQTLEQDANHSIRRYPAAVRFLIIMQTPNRANGRLIGFEDDRIKLRGIAGSAISKGTLLRVGDTPDTWEWIGVHAADLDGLIINSESDHGPVALTPDATYELPGRGLFRSLMPADEHEPGTTIIMGRRFQTVYTFGL